VGDMPEYSGADSAAGVSSAAWQWAMPSKPNTPAIRTADMQKRETPLNVFVIFPTG
jgi:hypothetical protein